ncbi:transglycosylase SLT domain-containing protein [Acidovorax sp. SUPP3434]|uniref:transglycosylase SLT domain-containing protein n=1 Tax=Acidovorax sp. SUPP3434 TaxID=2920880 RepID=UPI0032E9D71E
MAVLVAQGSWPCSALLLLRCEFSPCRLSPLLQKPRRPRQRSKHRSLLIRSAHAVWGLDAPVAVFTAQVHQERESAWRAGAASHVGAAGLAQFMPATLRGISTTDPALRANQPFSRTASW